MNSKLRMTRRVMFSSGHRYWNPELDEAANKALFGPWASPFNHGHNFFLDAIVEGDLQPTTGMVINIKRVDAILREKVIAEFDQRSINDEIPEFKTKAPSVENLLLHIRDSLPKMPEGAQLVGLRLQEIPTLWGELDRHGDDWKMTLTRTYEFAAAQRLHAPTLTEEENRAMYGVCNNPEGYGHNYTLEVTVAGEPDPRSGFLCDIGKFDEAVKRLVIDRYDHKCLFRDLPEFVGKITTCENIIVAIFEALKDQLPAKLTRIRLWETARNMFEINA